jgi:hypothetical protein
MLRKFVTIAAMAAVAISSSGHMAVGTASQVFGEKPTTSAMLEYAYVQAPFHASENNGQG